MAVACRPRSSLLDALECWGGEGVFWGKVKGRGGREGREERRTGGEWKWVCALSVERYSTLICVEVFEIIHTKAASSSGREFRREHSRRRANVLCY